MNRSLFGKPAGSLGKPFASDQRFSARKDLPAGIVAIDTPAHRYPDRDTACRCEERGSNTKMTALTGGADNECKYSRCDAVADGGRNLRDHWQRYDQG